MRWEFLWLRLQLARGLGEQALQSGWPQGLVLGPEPVLGHYWRSVLL